MAGQFEIDAGLFMRVRRAVGSEETRYYLTGVLIDPIEDGGAWLVATDGRAMLVARDDKAIAPRRAVIELTMPETPAPTHGDCDECNCALMPTDYDGCLLSFEVAAGKTGLAMIEQRKGWRQAVIVRCLGQPAERAYPTWGKVFTSTKTLEPRRGHETYGLDPALLSRIAGADKVALVDSGKPQAMRVLFDECGPIAGMLMPCDLNRTSESAALAAALSEPKEASHG